jgi:hypothetical protein
MVFNATFNNISVISWWSGLLVDETGVPRENHMSPPRHLSQLKSRAIPSNYPKVGKNFAVLDIFVMGYL